MCNTKNIISIAFATIFSISVYAGDTQLIDEKEIELWGYFTLSHKTERIDNKTLKTQVIKSKKQAIGLDDHYYYYRLTEECFTNSFSALVGRLNLISLDEKDYTLSELSGKCVLTIYTGANFATFKEQPRIFKLFGRYLNQISK